MAEFEYGSARLEWKNHWRVVAAAVAGVSTGAIPTYGLGLFIHPLEENLGWSRAQISSGLSIYSCIGLAGAPLVGMLIDRFGSRRIALFGVTAFCSLVAMLSLVTSSIQSWWLGWLFIGIAGLFIKPTVWSKAVTSFFDKGRGVALACMASGTGVSAAILPLLGNFFIEEFGWRLAFVGISACLGSFALVMLWMWFFDASDKPILSTDTRSKKERLQALPGWDAKVGLRRRQLYQISLAAFLATGVVTAYTVHMVSMLATAGIARDQAVAMFGMVGILAVIARLSVGYIFDKVAHPAVGTLSIALPIIPALVMLFMPAGPLMAICAVVAVGVAIGGEYDAVLYLSSRYFGLKAFGLLFGIVASAILAGLGIGSLVAGHIFDQTRSYDLFFLLSIPLTMVAAVMVATLGRYPDHGQPAHG